MTIHGTLTRATPISFDELRALLDAGGVCQTSTALPDEVTLSIEAARPNARLIINIAVPVQYADDFGGSISLGWIIDGETPEACEAARALLVRACKTARIAVQ